MRKIFCDKCGKEITTDVVLVFDYELDMSERGCFTCKHKKKKIPAVCHWQLLTPAHFDDIPWTKNETLKK